MIEHEEVEEIMDDEDQASASDIADRVWEYIWAEMCIATTKIFIRSLGPNEIEIASVGNTDEETKHRTLYTGGPMSDDTWKAVLDDLNTRFMRHNMSDMSSERLPVPTRSLKLISKGRAYCG